MCVYICVCVYIYIYIYIYIYKRKNLQLNFPYGQILYIKILKYSTQKAAESESVKVLVAQPCPTLCNPMSYSSPGSSVHWILQARILAWVAIPFSRGSS